MKNNFNELIDSFSENRVGIANDFLGSALAENLRNNLMDRYRSDLLLKAGTGNNQMGENSVFIMLMIVSRISVRKREGVYFSKVMNCNMKYCLRTNQG